MGNKCCGEPLNPDEVHAKEASKKIDEDIAKSKKDERKEVKLLLLGTYPSRKKKERRGTYTPTRR